MDRAPHFERSAGWMQAAYLARVVDIADPERRDRVQVRLHAFDDAGHYVLEDRHEVLVPAIRRFLDANPLL